MTDWSRQLLHAARGATDLVDRGLVSPGEAAGVQAVADRYELLASDYYLGLIDPADPADPIRKMALPDLAELVETPGELSDPIGDAAHAPTSLLVHRYPDRVLLFPTFRCPMYCRYCFRKVALNGDPPRLAQALAESLDYLRGHPEVREVILSGGDPLMLPDARLDALLASVRAVPSIERLRIHTRFPVTLPARVDAALARMLASHRPLFVVTHFNHPREMTPQARAAVGHLVDAGITVLNQAVLLAGVNDAPETLAALFGGLLAWQVRPYYLHHPDLTVGTQHFRVSLTRGLEIVRALRGRLTGLAWPTYVLDIPGGRGKVPVDSGFVQPTAERGVWHLVSPLGGTVTYRDPAEL